MQLCIIMHYYDRSLVCVSFLMLRSPQDTWSQPQGYPLQRPLTPLEPEDARTALEIYKLVCGSD